MSWNPTKFEAIFHSEISSSYLLYEIFQESTAVAKSFLKHFFGRSAEKIQVFRERALNDRTGKYAGSVDLLFEFSEQNQPVQLGLEVKVHDYFSATRGQISVYYNALKDMSGGNPFYFGYLTQFGASAAAGNYSPPATVYEAETLKAENNFRHLTWSEFYLLLDRISYAFSPEVDLLFRMQRAWMEQKCRNDFQVYGALRPMSLLFPDIGENTFDSFPGVREQKPTGQSTYTLDLSRAADEPINLDRLFACITGYIESGNVKVDAQCGCTAPETLRAASSLFHRLADDAGSWELLDFYARLFQYVRISDRCALNGKSNFSILLTVKNRNQPISLCTLYRNGLIRFYPVR